MDAFLWCFLGLVVAHALCDFPLQGDFLARMKQFRRDPRSLDVPWWWCLAMHCAIQAGGVYVVTGSRWLAVAEFFAHALVDLAKCDDRITFGQDQAAHVGFRAAWAALAVFA